ncbi:MAG TPA: ferritin-like domain-containing protein [Mycobacteriales bacterium]|nr:ferritin-like domain-containing protein [Mycobacteriales bacterium]
MSADSTLRGLQVALAAEHAVIWGYGLVGAKIGDGRRARVRQADLAHRARRDATAATIRGRGGDPVDSRAAYHVPFPVTDERSALRLAVHLEEGAARAWHYLLGATSEAPVRTDAVGALSDSAVQATMWRAALNPADAAVAFPGGKP